ncbi:MAG: phosphodiester glycosidase family protein [Actinomycetaceae bacterium]|nr:phosphodiester glycosidase family protein [Actinomycetaceae bacterium]
MNETSNFDNEQIHSGESGATEPAAAHGPVGRREQRAHKREARKARRGRRRKIILGSSLALAVVAGSGTVWALNRYVIEHIEISNVSQYEKQLSKVSGASTSFSQAAEDIEALVTDTSYTASNGSITIEKATTGSGDDTVTYYVATVDPSDGTAVRSAFANDAYGQNIIEKTSTIAQNNGAIFAINGDYYGFRSSGIIVRNGVAYRDNGTRTGLAMYRDGTVKIYDETTTTADELVEEGVWNTLSFGPAIVENGEIVSGIEDVEVDTNFGNHSIQGNQPRTLVGAKEDGTLVFVVVDGRNKGYSRGVTMTEAAEIMQSLGCETAYNLDGGGSSTMYFNGQVVNQPGESGKERGTSDILYVEDLS